jgi:hypothetical protein
MTPTFIFIFILSIILFLIAAELYDKYRWKKHKNELEQKHAEETAKCPHCGKTEHLIPSEDGFVMCGNKLYSKDVTLACHSIIADKITNIVKLKNSYKEFAAKTNKDMQELIDSTHRIVEAIDKKSKACDDLVNVYKEMLGMVVADIDTPHSIKLAILTMLGKN